MWPVLRQALARGWGQMLGWGLSLGVLAAYLVRFYDTIAENRAGLEQVFANYPPELMAFFGDIAEMFTPEGFLHVEFFTFLPLVLGIYAVLAGSGLVAADEESGVLDLILAHPIRRLDLFMGRVAGMVCILFGILGVAWLGLYFGQAGTTLSFSPLELARPIVSIAAELLFFAALALLLSLVLPSRRAAGLVAGLALVASFFLTAIGRMDDNLANAARLSPLYYYQGGQALSGLNWGWIAGLGFSVGLMLALAAWRFSRRDIRVSGEGSLWQKAAKRASDHTPKPAAAV